MRKLFTTRSIAMSICSLSIGLWSCSHYSEDNELEQPTDQAGQTRQGIAEEVVFHEGTESWIRHRNDPYTLENFQRAYDNLASGRSTLPLTRSQTSAFSGTEQLTATHYSLKIYPKNEKEQWEIASMEDVQVSYVPLDYVQLSEEEIEALPALTRSGSASYPESSPYTVTYDGLETEYGPAPAETYTMPIMYAVWPLEKPLPEDMDYEIDYEVFIPYQAAQTRSVGLNEEAIQVLEREAINLSVQVTPPPGLPIFHVRIIAGKVEYYDRYLGKTVPQPNLGQLFRLGSNIWRTVTDLDGYFSITAPIPNEASYSHVFEQPQWKITTENSTAPISTPCQTVGYWWGGTTKKQVTICPSNSGLEYDINPIVNYYFNGPHSIRTWCDEDRIRIIAATQTLATADAMFTYGKDVPVFITVYLNKKGHDSMLAGAVAHEFGHYTHYRERGGYFGFKPVHDLLKESYAQYVGWHIGEKYYADLGYVKSQGDNITSCAAQGWEKTMSPPSAHYSPMFVDLVDDYDQSKKIDTRILNPDRIKNVPHSLIRKIATECTDWNSVKLKLRRYIGLYYTVEDLYDYQAPYDYWVAHNSI